MFDGRCSSHQVILNGKLLPAEITDGTMPTMPAAGLRAEGGTLVLPPISVTFVLVEGLELPALCGGAAAR